MKTTGHTVLITGRRDEAAKLQHATPYACDISVPDQVTALVDYVRREHPGLDVLFLNAGVTHGYQLFGEVDPIAPATAEVEVNYLSALRLTHALEPLLRAQPDPR